MTLTRKLGDSYEHVQSTPSASWVVVHNLGMYPVADIYIDYEGEKHKILPLSVEYTDLNTCTITFSIPRTGLATVA